MRPLTLVSVVALVGTTLAQYLCETELAFYKSKLIPDVLADFQPQKKLFLTFTDDQGAEVAVERPGEQLTMKETANIPKVELSADVFDGSIPHLLDPDAPTPEDRHWSPVRHWIAPNYASQWGGVDDRYELKNSTPAYSEYISPAPPYGAHRYVVLVYRQNKIAELQTPWEYNRDSVLSFDFKGFMNAQNETEFTLIAGTYFSVSPDPVKPS
ncbi:phosphatidylethanolamine-binding protein [Auriculariales sp. MPI-PUGE-AT-0066]|nr:phosphatidylethanolamine-binding protein [Auriculariales sp. MPI-PUGE-AT-0066]